MTVICDFLAHQCFEPCFEPLSGMLVRSCSLQKIDRLIYLCQQWIKDGALGIPVRCGSAPSGQMWSQGIIMVSTSLVRVITKHFCIVHNFVLQQCG